MIIDLLQMDHPPNWLRPDPLDHDQEENKMTLLYFF